MISGTGLQPIGRLWNEMDRLFDDVFQPLSRLGALSGMCTRPFPALNVWEDDRALFVEAEVPGLDMDHLEITVQENELTLKGQRENGTQQHATCHRRERSVGSFARTLRLPTEIDADKVQAALSNGVLTITLPKAESVLARKIEVRTVNN